MAEPISPTPASRPGLQPALNVVGLSHRYGDRQALQSVSFDVAPGESFGLLGPNGGGKTTFFRIAATLLTPTNGTVRVFGHDVATHPDAVRRCIGMTFQSPALDDRLHVVENLHYHGHLYGLHGKSLNQRIDEALSLVNLTDRASDLVSTLSGGLQRRVELAKTLLAKPCLLYTSPSPRDKRQSRMPSSA